MVPKKCFRGLRSASRLCWESPMRKITSKQIRALWGYAALLKVPEEKLREWIYAETGKSSLRELSLLEASRLIGEMGWEMKLEVGGLRSRDRMTPAQFRKIGRMGTEIGWNQERILGLAGRMYRVERLHDLDQEKASGLIEALKAIQERNLMKKAA